MLPSLIHSFNSDFIPVLPPPNTTSFFSPFFEIHILLPEYHHYLKPYLVISFRLFSPFFNYYDEFAILTYKNFFHNYNILPVWEISEQAFEQYITESPLSD